MNSGGRCIFRGCTYISRSEVRRFAVLTGKFVFCRQKGERQGNELVSTLRGSGRNLRCFFLRVTVRAAQQVVGCCATARRADETIVALTTTNGSRLSLFNAAALSHRFHSFVQNNFLNFYREKVRQNRKLSASDASVAVKDEIAGLFLGFLTRV